MKIKIRNSCRDFNSYRAARVKSLFNPERGDEFALDADVPGPDEDWQIGVVVGPSGSGKSSIGRKLGGGITDLYAGWPDDAPIIDAIAPEGDFNVVTGSLAAVGLGDVPAWLRPFKALSNGQQFRAGLARCLCDPPDVLVVDEFTSVIDRQIAKIGALAFAKTWRRLKGKRVVLLSCHYDILDWIEPDWVFDTGKDELTKKARPAGLGNAPESNSKFGRSIQPSGPCLSRIII
jgi:ABC-type ATPase with predicted acetyltransferase domain